MHLLTLRSANDVHNIITPMGYESKSMSSPALAVVTDFKVQQPSVIQADTPAVQAEFLMLKAHVKLKIVVDEKGEFLGIITWEDLEGQQVMQKVAKGADRGDITVKDLMRTPSMLKTLDYDELSGCTVGEVVETLKANGVQHCLVTEHGSDRLRGLISASDIARQLQIPLHIHQTPTFADLFNAIHP